MDKPAYSHDLFLSYSRADKHVVDKLESAFRAQGFDVWRDESMRNGAHLSHTIAHQIGCSRAVLVLWSTSSIGSDWVFDEATDASKQNKFFHARIEDVTPPAPFGARLYRDLIGWPDDELAKQSFLKLCDDICADVPTHVGPRTTYQAHAPATKRRPRFVVGSLVAGLVLGAGWAAWNIPQEQTEREVTHVGRDARGRVTKLCNEAVWGEVSKYQAIQQINDDTYQYLVMADDGRPAPLVVSGPPNNHHLKSARDVTTTNNLTELPSC